MEGVEAGLEAHGGGAGGEGAAVAEPGAAGGFGLEGEGIAAEAVGAGLGGEDLAAFRCRVGV